MVPTRCSILVKIPLISFVSFFFGTLSAVFAANGSISSNPTSVSNLESFCNKLQFTYVPALQRCCRVCTPGSGVIRRCTADSNSECAPCSPGHYSVIADHNEGCHRCPICQANSHQVQACSAEKPTECECNAGYFHNSVSGSCEKCSSCYHGFGAVAPCTAHRNTECERCPNGTFSDIIAIDSQCQYCANCTGNQEITKACTLETNSVCEGESEDICWISLMSGMWTFMAVFILFAIALIVQLLLCMVDFAKYKKELAAARQKDDENGQLISPLTAKEKTCTDILAKLEATKADLKACNAESQVRTAELMVSNEELKDAILKLLSVSNQKPALDISADLTNNEETNSLVATPRKI